MVVIRGTRIDDGGTLVRSKQHKFEITLRKDGVVETVRGASMSVNHRGDLVIVDKSIGASGYQIEKARACFCSGSWLKAKQVDE